MELTYTDRQQQLFWSRVEQTDGCWHWTGYTMSNGYGQVGFVVPHGSRLAHRVSYAMEHGSIDPELTIDHLCMNRRCVRPSHLEQVTQRENTLRGNTTSGINFRKTHCDNGHEFNDTNTYIASNGWRGCRPCNAERARARRARIAKEAA